MGLFWPRGRSEVVLSWDGAAGEHRASSPRAVRGEGDWEGAAGTKVALRAWDPGFGERRG